ncbi:MAG TPA: hypothetical protein EYG51_20595 [Pseudomonadales bacterium]|nr:hypothetical protein [Pseudomonadales bacterium]
MALALPTFLIAIPFFHVYANNVTNLQLPVSFFTGNLSLICLGTSLAFYTLTRLFPAQHERGLMALTFAIILIAWLQTNVFIGSYGFLSGETPNWSDGLWLQAGQGALLIALTLLCFTAVDTLCKNIAFLCSLLALTSLAYLPELLEKTRSVEVKKYTFTKDGIYNFSNTQNVIIFVLDSAQADVVNEILEEVQPIKDKFQGFTMFRNSVSAFPKTYASIPALLSGRSFDNSETLPRYLRKAYVEESISARLKEAGYDARYSSSSPHSLFAHPLVAENVADVEGALVDSENVITKDSELLANMILFRLSPHLLKPYIYNQGDFLLSFKKSENRNSKTATYCQLNKDTRRHSKERRSFDNTLLDEFRACANKSLEEPAFRFFHLYAPHAPYRLDATFQNIGIKPLKREWFLLQTKGVLNVLGELIGQLDERGILEKSLVVIVSDHGEGEYNVGLNLDLTLPPRTKTRSDTKQSLVRGGIPLMMIKRPQDSGDMQYSDAPVQLTDVPATIYDWIGVSNPTEGRAVFSIEPEEQRKRTHRYYRFSGWNIDYILPLTEYTIDGFSWYPESWAKSDTNFDTRASNSFNGQLVTLRKGGNLKGHLHSGWSDPLEDGRMIKNSSASITLDGNSTSVLTVIHGLHQRENSSLDVLRNGMPIESWLMANNDGQRYKTAILPGSQTQTVVFSKKDQDAPQPLFKELRLEPISNYSYELGTDINFTDLGNSAKYRTYGWSRTEHWGTSSIGHSSGVIMTLAQAPRQDLRLKVRLSGYVFEQWPEQEIEILVNKIVVGNLSLKDKTKQNVDFVVPYEVITPEGLIDLSFRYLNPVRQKEIGISGDNRLQSIAMINLVLDQPPSNEGGSESSDEP